MTLVGRVKQHYRGANPLFFLEFFQDALYGIYITQMVRRLTVFMLWSPTSSLPLCQLI